MNECMVDVMRHIRNFFERGYIDGEFTISDDGEISPADGIANQYIAIQGSISHDGVYPCTNGWLGYDEEMPFGETFKGRVWLLHPPASFVRICKMVEAFQRSASEHTGPFQSESYDTYSYSKASGKDGGLMTWQEAFEKELMPYRHMFTEVDI